MKVDHVGVDRFNGAIRVFGRDVAPDVGRDHYAIAVYLGPAFVGFVPGTYRDTTPVNDPRSARKISLAADARSVAAGLAGLWGAVGYTLRAWDLATRAPLED